MPITKLCIRYALKLSVLVLPFFVPATSFGQANVPSLVPFPIEVAFIPQDYNNYDFVEIVVTGTFPSTCYKVGPHETSIDVKNRVLKISQMAYQYHSAKCNDRYPIKFSRVIPIGLMPAARDVVYKVTDGNYESSFLGRLPIKKVLSKPPVDSSVFAPVDGAYVDPRNKVAVITGMLPSSCLSVSEVRISRSGKNVVIVRPIMKRFDETNCIDGNFPYKKSVSLPPLEIGTYLLQVRSTNGKFFENIFEWYPPD